MVAGHPTPVMYTDEDTGAPYPPVDGTQPCAEMDTEMFFGDSDLHPAPAAYQACARCPFQRPCLEYALDRAPWVHGVWGGVAGYRRIRAYRRIRRQPAERGRQIRLLLDSADTRTAS